MKLSTAQVNYQPQLYYKPPQRFYHSNCILFKRVFQKAGIVLKLKCHYFQAFFFYALKKC